MPASEWTPAIGLRDAIAALLIRTLIITPFWTGAMILAAPVRPWIVAGGWAGLFIIGLVLAIPGAIIGHLISRDLIEKAGMTSLLITMAAIGSVAAIVFGGDALAHQLHTFDEGGGWFIRIVASAWVIRSTILDT